MKHIISLLVVAALAGPLLAQTPEETFQRALRLERTQGDYAGAIALYESIARDTDDRRLGARALIQAARAQENLGRAEAAETYRRVMADYAEIADLAAEARAGYARTREPVSSEAEAGSVTRIVWPSNGKGSTALSPSGDRVIGVVGGANRPYPSEDPFGLLVIDVATGDGRHIPLEAPERSWSNYAKFSPDERQVALVVNRRGQDDPVSQRELRVVDLETGEPQVVFDLEPFFQGGSEDEECGWAQVGEWTPDGSGILITAGVNRPCNDGVYSEQLVHVPLNQGSPHTIGRMLPEEELSREQACYSGDGQYVFVDIDRTGDSIIRRFEVATGANAVWRGRSFLSGCSEGSGPVLYQRGGIAGTQVFAGSPETLDASTDVEVARLPRNSWTQAGSKNGDVLAFEGHVAGREFMVAELDAESGEPSRIQESLGPIAGNLYMSWDPAGERLAFDYWRPGGRQLVIWTGGTGERTILDGLSRANQLRWSGDASFQFMSHRGDDSWERSLMDLSSGSTLQVSKDATDAAGLLTPWPIDSERWVAWSPQEECLIEFDAQVLETRKIRCFDTDGFVAMTPLPSPFSDEILTIGIRPDSTATLGVLSHDGLSYATFLSESWSGNGRQLASISWLSEDTISFGRLTGDEFSSMLVVNVRIGGTREILVDFLTQFQARRLSVSTGLRYVAAQGSEREGAKMLTVIHNVLGTR